MNAPQQPNQLDYQLRGWAWALAWADPARDQGLVPRAPRLVDQLGEPANTPDRPADARAMRPEGIEGVAAELWVEGDYIIWRWTDSEKVFRAYR